MSEYFADYTLKQSIDHGLVFSLVLPGVRTRGIHRGTQIGLRDMVLCPGLAKARFGNIQGGRTASWIGGRFLRRGRRQPHVRRPR
jgi:hypothetical protein